MVVLWMRLAQMLMVASVVVTLVHAGVLEMSRLVLFLVVEVGLVVVMGVTTMVLLLMMLLACVSPSVVPLFLHLTTCREGEYLARAYSCMRTPYAVPACCLVGARVRRTISARRISRPIMFCHTVRSHDTQLAMHAPCAPTAAHALSWDVRCPSPSCVTYRSHPSARLWLLLVASGAARKPRVLVLRILPRSPRAGSEAVQPP